MLLLVADNPVYQGCRFFIKVYLLEEVAIVSDGPFFDKKVNLKKADFALKCRNKTKECPCYLIDNVRP